MVHKQLIKHILFKEGSFCT